MNLPFDVRTVLVELKDSARMGVATKQFQDYLTALTLGIPSYSPVVVNAFGTSNDTAPLQKAINQAAAIGGSTIILPPGVYTLDTVTFPAGDAPITLIGQGDSTILRRRRDLNAGAGMLDIFGANVTLDSLAIDGIVTTPTGLLYNGGFSTALNANDPMAPPLTLNSSIWLHGGANRFSCQRVKIQNTGGYSGLVDAGQSGISDVRFENCRFLDNRPHLFGVTAGNEDYGSWTGGLYVNGDGRSDHLGCVVRGFIVSQCQFLRCTGNQVWSHLYGLDELHEDFQIFSNYFRDIGLDGVLVGGVTGGSVIGNTFRRIGYTTLTNADQSVPRWLQNLNATAIDSSGLVKAVIYSGNSMLSVNGGAIDLDGHGLSVIGGNAARVPYPDEAEYDEDQIGSSGFGNAGSTSYGINLSNSSGSVHGASELNIYGNSLINLRSGALRLFAARRCSVTGNTIIAPSNSVYPPIGMGPIGSNPNQRCINNKITGNYIEYSPAASAPAIFEDDSISQFVSGESNTVCNNVPINPPGTLATEFLPSPHSSSVHYAETVWWP